MSRRALVAALLFLPGVAWLGWTLYQRSGPAPVCPEHLETLDPLVRELLLEELAHVDRRRRSADAWLRLGMAEEANALFGEAEQSYRTALHLRPEHAKTLHRLACVEERLGDLVAAADTMARAAAVDPFQAASWWRLAWWRIDLGHTEAAALALERARSLAPADPAVRFARVRLALARRSPAEAELLLRSEGLLQGDDAPYAQHLLASALRQQGDLEGAAQASGRADGRGPRLGDPWMLELQRFETGSAALRLRAGREVQAGRYAEAERRLEQVLALDPADTRSLNMLAVCRLEQGDAAAALALLQRLFALEPEHYEGTLQYVRVLLRQGDAAPEVLHAAEERLARAQATRPDDPGSWRLRATLASALHQPEAELAALERAIALEPAAPELRLRAAYTLLGLGRLEDALARFLALQQEQPAQTEAWFGEATTRLRAGDAPGARSALVQLSQRADADPDRLAKLRAALAPR